MMIVGKDAGGRNTFLRSRFNFIRVGIGSPLA